MLTTCLNRISEAMQVPMLYDSTKAAPLSGKAVGHYTPLPGLDIKFTVRAEKLFYFNQAGVLFHIMGSFWVLVSHYDATGTTTVFFVDASKCEMDGVMITPDKLINRKSNLKEAVDVLRPAIVKSFIHKSGAWVVLPLPK